MSEQYQMQIWFRGVCTHFHNNVLPGIPHRVVFPDATPMRFGLITQPTIEGPPATTVYVLMPHAPHMSVAAPWPNDFNTIEGIMQDGYMYTRSALEILNIVETSVTYPEDPAPPLGGFIRNVLPVASFVQHFDYSGEVVLGGRASGYFDLHGGSIATFTEDEGAVRVVATVTTDGPPQLQITPFATMGSPLPRRVITLPGAPLPSSTSLIVGNVGPFCADGQYDYLLHFLAGIGGIPTSVLKPLPGIREAADCIPPVEALQMLIDYKFPKNMPIIEDVELMASCSDSRYP